MVKPMHKNHKVTTDGVEKIDYGLDAPDLMKMFFLAGLSASTVAAFCCVFVYKHSTYLAWVA
jgi:hypothetical protein